MKPNNMEKTQVIVGMGSCGIAAGARKVYEKIDSILKSNGNDFELKKTSCVGMCYREPLVEVIDKMEPFCMGMLMKESPQN